MWRAYADHRVAAHEPATVRAMLADYRAGLGLDREHGEADRRLGRRLSCWTLVLGSLRDDLEELHGNVREVWRPWATDRRERGRDGSHHMAEEAPEELVARVPAFPKEA